MFILGVLHLILATQAGLVDPATRRTHLNAALAGLLSFGAFTALLLLGTELTKILSLISLATLSIPNIQLLRSQGRSAMLSRVVGGADLLVSSVIWIMLSR